MMTGSKKRLTAKLTDGFVLQVLAIIGLMAAAVFVGDVMVKVVGGDALPEPVMVTLDPADFGGELPDGVEITEMQAQLSAEVEPGWRVVWGLLSIVPALIVGWALWILIGLLRDEHDPFTVANVKRFKLLAGLAFAYLVFAAVRAPLELELQRSIGLEIVAADFEFTIPAVLGLLSGSFAEVFRRGVTMREERELTI